MKPKYLAGFLNKNSTLGSFSVHRDVIACESQGKIRVCLYIGTRGKRKTFQHEPIQLSVVRKLQTSKKFAQELDDKVKNCETLNNIIES